MPQVSNVTEIDYKTAVQNVIFKLCNSSFLQFLENMVCNDHVGHGGIVNILIFKDQV